MTTTKGMTINVRPGIHGQDTEVTVLHITEDGMYAVVDGRKLNKNFPYPTCHIGRGVFVPGSPASRRILTNAKKFADEFAAKGWFKVDGSVSATVSSEERLTIVNWARDWSPS